MTYVLQSRRLGLRQLTMDDLDEMTRLLGNAAVMRYYPRPKTHDEAAAWIQWNLDLYKKHGYGLWAVELLEDGTFLGDCGLTPQVVDGVTEIELGYHIHSEYWKQGFASEAANQCVEYARNILKASHIVGLMMPENIASQRVAEKAGLTFDRYGEHNRRRDVIMKITFN